MLAALLATQSTAQALEDDSALWSVTQNAIAVAAFTAVAVVASLGGSQARAAQLYDQQEVPQSNVSVSPTTYPLSIQQSRTTIRYAFPDDEFVPAVTFVADEDVWVVKVPAAPTSFGPLYLPDPESAPATTVHDEDAWHNPAQPVPQQLGRLYLPDPSDQRPAQYTLTVTPNSGNAQATFLEFTGAVWNGTDGTASATGTVSPGASGNLSPTPLVNGDVIVSGLLAVTPVTGIAAGGGFTLENQLTSLSLEPYLYDEQQIQVTAGTVNPSFTFVGGTGWIVNGIAFKKVSGTASLVSSQNATAIGGSPCVIGTPLPPSVGDLLVCQVGSTDPSLTISDSQGNAWVQGVQSASQGGYYLTTFYFFPPLAFQPDEDYWQNSVAPAPGYSSFKIFTDEDFIAPPNPVLDEGLWISANKWPAQWNIPLFGSTVTAAQAPSVEDEDYWQSGVSPVQLTLTWPNPWIFDQNESDSLYGQPDEDFWNNPVAPIAGYPWTKPFVDDEIIFVAPIEDEVFWQNPTAPVQAGLAWPNPWIFDQHDPDSLHGQPDEDFWTNPVHSIWSYALPQIFTADEQIVPSFQPTEDVWNSSWLPILDPPPQLFIYNDDIEVPTSISVDEDYRGYTVTWPSRWSTLLFGSGQGAFKPVVFQPDEDFWINPVAPVPCIEYQRLPYGSLLDPDEIPAGHLFPPFIDTDEDFWHNAVAPVPSYPVPKVFTDDDVVEQIPPIFGSETDIWQHQVTSPSRWTVPQFGSSAAALSLSSVHFDEDFWKNPVAPIVAYPVPQVFTYDDIPPGVPASFQVDDDYHAYRFNSSARWITPLFGSGQGAKSPTPFVPDEDASPVPQLTPEPLQQILLFMDDGSSVTPFYPDEDYWPAQIIIVPPVSGYVIPKAFSYDEFFVEQPTSIHTDEDFWTNFVQPLQSSQGRLYLPDPEEIPAGYLEPPGSANPIDEYWLNPTPPVPGSNYVPVPYVPDAEEIPAHTLYGHVDEDYWINPIAPVFAYPVPIVFSAEEDVLAIGTDEDFWLNPVAPVPLTLGRLYLPDPEEIPFLTGPEANPIDEYWQNPVAPVPPSHYVQLPYLPDPEEIPAGSLFEPFSPEEDYSQLSSIIPEPLQQILLFMDDGSSPNSLHPDEDFWPAQTIIVPPIWAYPVPKIFTDDDVLPTPPSAIHADEDFWINPVQSVPLSFGKLYLPDPEELSEPFGPAPGQPDEDFWINPVAPVPQTMWQRLPYLPDSEEIPAGYLIPQPDEDYWQNPVPPVVATEYQRLPFGSLLDPDEIPVGNFFGQADEDYWQNPAAPIFAPNYLLLPYLPDPEELPAAMLYGQPDEDFWTNPVPPVAGYPVPKTFSDDEIIFAFSTAEDFWTNPVAPVQYLPPTQAFTDDDVIEITPPIQDEDFWTNAIAPVFSYPVPFLFNEDVGLVIPLPIQDEDFWQNPAAPAFPPNYIKLPYLPDPEELPAGSFIGSIPLTCLGKGAITSVYGKGTIGTGTSDILASDSFERDNQNPLAGPWSTPTGYSPLQIIDDAVSPTGTAPQTGLAIYSAVSWQPDQSCQIKLVQLAPNSGYIALVLRCDAVGQNLYYIDLDASFGFGGIGLSTPLNIQKVVSGTPQLAAQIAYVTPSIGDVFMASIAGATISVYQNDNFIGSYTDTDPIVSGAPGIWLETVPGTSDVSELAISDWIGEGTGPVNVRGAGIIDAVQVANQNTSYASVALGSDTFTRNDEDPLNPANWTVVDNPSAYSIAIVNNEATMSPEAITANGYSWESWNQSPTWSGNQFASVNVDTLEQGGLATVCLFLRCTEDGNTGYKFTMSENLFNVASFEISVIVNGIETVLLGILSRYVSGAPFTVIALGSSLMVLYNGVVLNSVQDSTISGNGSVQLQLFYASASGVEVSEFSAGVVYLLPSTVKGVGRID